jgi:hypothetical protein
MEEGRREAVCGSDPENPSHAHQRFAGVVLRPRNAGMGEKASPGPVKRRLAVWIPQARLP